ncbi:MAG: DUF1826 domain-containing protein [Marinobacterium sp.]|nr:DUF1826 domain-containing protein [Marinobacterium sp.]
MMKAADTTPRKQYSDHNAQVFGRIYEDSCNMTCWQRSLSDAPLSDQLMQYAAQLPDNINLKQVLPLTGVKNSLLRLLPEGPGQDALINDIYLLTDMFTCLFELEEVGMRLAVLTRPMCPRFHVDHIPCRLVTSWSGNATEWMSKPLHMLDDRDTLDSSLFQRLNTGDVALIKGDGWYNNQGNGLVHRSPQASASQPRLFMSLDFA